MKKISLYSTFSPNFLMMTIQTLCDPVDYTVHGILQARILEWVAFPFFRGIFPTQGQNPGLLHFRQILYQLSQHGRPSFVGRRCNAILWDLPLGALPRSQSKYWRKTPLCFWQGHRKRSYFKIYQSPLILASVTYSYMSMTIVVFSLYVLVKCLLL